MEEFERQQSLLENYWDPNELTHSIISQDESAVLKE